MQSRYSVLIISITALVYSVAVLGVRTTASAADSPASISGEVKFQGTPPKPTRIDVSQDPLCAKAHSTPLTTEDILVGPDGGLANVVVYISDGLSTQTFQPPQQPAVLEQKGCQYKPHVLAVQSNQKINIINSDETTHNIHPSPVNNRSTACGLTIPSSLTPAESTMTASALGGSGSFRISAFAGSTITDVYMITSSNVESNITMISGTRRKTVAPMTAPTTAAGRKPSKAAMCNAHGTPSVKRSSHDKRPSVAPSAIESHLAGRRVGAGCLATSGRRP